jgi:CHAD domain-containing protein
MAQSTSLRRTAAATAATAAAAAAGKVAHDRLSSKRAKRTYRFLEGEPLPDAARRVAYGRIDHALDELSGKSDSDAETAVHEARKDMKKLRALLRLFRDELGDEAYRSENEAFRGVARRLSGARDADVMLGTLDRLRAATGSELSSKVHSGLRRALKEHRRSLEGTAAGRRRTLNEARADLKEARSRVESWQLGEDAFGSIEPGLRRTYRRGRRSMQTAEQQPSTENLHEWRKRAKDHWYHLRLLRDSWPGPMGALADEADTLSECLGEDHDLAVLADAAREREGALGGPGGLEELERAVGRRRDELQSHALELGRRLYAEKSGAFAARMARWWQAREPAGAV